MSASAPSQTSRDNLTGSLFMIFAMALFTLEDSVVKKLTADLPVSQVLILFGLGGMITFAILAKQRGDMIFTRELREPTMLIRTMFEILGRLFFVLALTYSAFSTTSAILQATPLLVTAAGSFIFKERVSALRWSLILLGFVGVLLVLQPGTDGFSLTSIFAVLGMIGFGARDLGTRAAPKGLSYAQLGVYGFTAVLIAGFLFMFWDTGPQAPSLANWGQLGLLWTLGVIAYAALTFAMRTGQLSVVTPFRYSRMLFAMAFAAFVLGERPSALELLGAAVIVLAGLALMATSRK